MNPNLHESDPDLHEMAPKTSMNGPDGTRWAPAPKRIAISGFSMIQFMVKWVGEPMALRRAYSEPP